jgi:retron-type reverse transcriptase
MTKTRYLCGCESWSQVSGEAAGVSPNAWNVNANNGNVNNNHRNNTGFALAVRRVGEFQGEQALPLRALYIAWRRARRQKVPSFNQLAFDLDWSGNLIRLQAEILERRWTPRPSTCFIATRPKAREIHAPDFSDRVMHHWLVPQLESIYEPAFIHDSYANRKGKGTHAAVRRARQFVRQVRSGQGRGWYLQLDVHNFFNSIHRPTLWELLRERMRRASLPDIAQHAAHALLRRSPLSAGVRYRSSVEERALVPRHKRLECAPRDCGLPIGNLSSQFFANVYLNELDQFVKHTLRAQRYVRYVDDFVLVHQDREQLARWRAAIESFLRDRLKLQLKADQRLRALSDGIDFLGYVVYPTHTRVRRRVVRHAVAAIKAASRARNPAGREHLRSVLASYVGHFSHADAWRLRTRIEQLARGRL